MQLRPAQSSAASPICLSERRSALRTASPPSRKGVSPTTSTATLMPCQLPAQCVAHEFPACPRTPTPITRASAGMTSAPSELGLPSRDATSSPGQQQEFYQKCVPTFPPVMVRGLSSSRLLAVHNASARQALNRLFREPSHASVMLILRSCVRVRVRELQNRSPAACKASLRCATRPGAGTTGARFHATISAIWSRGERFADQQSSAACSCRNRSECLLRLARSHSPRENERLRSGHCHRSLTDVQSRIAFADVS